jgi:ER lumen protein retaining receptor
MKIVFIGTSFYTIYLMKVKFKATYDQNLDTFRMEYLFLFAAVSSLVLCYEYTPVEVNKGK